MDCAVNEDWVRRFKDTQESVHVAAPRFMAYLCFYMVVLIPLSFWSCTGCWYGEVAREQGVHVRRRRPPCPLRGPWSRDPGPQRGHVLSLETMSGCNQLLVQE